MSEMNDSGGPTYASLTPANPTIINGLANVDPQTGQYSSHTTLFNNTDTLNIINTNASDVNIRTSQVENSTSLNSMSPSVMKPELKYDEHPDLSANLDKSALIAVLQFLKKNQLKDTEDCLRRESSYYDDVEDVRHALGTDAEVSSVLCSYKSEGDPNEYEDAYKALAFFVEKSLDAYKYELSMVLYPVFVHMYLELVYNEHEEIAKNFLVSFGNMQEDYYHEDIRKLSIVTTKEHMTGYQIMDNFRSGLFTVRMSRDSYNNLKRFMTDRCSGVISRIIQDCLYLDVYEGVPRTSMQVHTVAGAQEGEATRQVNQSKMYYGLLKEPELPNIIMEEEEEGDDSEKPKKKKPKKDIMQKNKRNDPNAPANNRIPLPDMRDIDKCEKGRACRDALKRAVLNKDTLPSICFYSFLNSAGSISCVDITDDSSILVFGTTSSQIHVHSITPLKLKNMRPSESLSEIDKEAEDVLVRMMDDKTAESSKILIGHSGPVHACSFSPDRNLLLSAGEDGTVRLWSLKTWTCLVIYKGHIFPVWDVKFSPHGYYFVSGGHDRTARLWTTDQHQAVRIFAGHFSDVDVVQFHPNSNYVASASSDRSIRVWDCLNGSCVRVMTGHKKLITCVIFSPCGRYLASGSVDKDVLIWDMANGHLIAQMTSHKATVLTVSFSRCCNILVSGGLDNCVKVWDFNRVTEDSHDDEINTSHNPELKRTGEALLLATFPTKNTPVFFTHFTRRNVLLAAGPFDQ